MSIRIPQTLKNRTAALACSDRRLLQNTSFFPVSVALVARALGATNARSCEAHFCTGSARRKPTSLATVMPAESNETGTKTSAKTAQGPSSPGVENQPAAHAKSTLWRLAVSTSMHRMGAVGVVRKQLLRAGAFGVVRVSGRRSEVTSSQSALAPVLSTSAAPSPPAGESSHRV